MTAEAHQGWGKERQINREKASVEVKWDERMKRQRGESERERERQRDGEFWLSELISISSREEDWWTLEEGVCVCTCACVLKNGGQASVSTDALTSSKENTFRGVTCVYVHYTAVQAHDGEGRARPFHVPTSITASFPLPARELSCDLWPHPFIHHIVD